MKAFAILLLSVLMLHTVTTNNTEMTSRDPARELSYSYETSNSACNACINISSKKWCKYYSSTTSGYCCDTSDTSSYCGGSSSYYCSNNSSRYSSNSKYTLCPKDSSCGTQYQSLSSSDTDTFTSGYVPTTETCWYEVYVSSSYISQVTIDITSISGGTAEIYYEDSNYFTYKASKSSTGSSSYSVSRYDSIFVLFIPSSSSGYITFKSKSNNSYSSSSSYSSDTSWIYMVIFIPIGVFWLIFGIAIVSGIIRRKRLQQMQMNMANANAQAVQNMNNQPIETNNMYNQPNSMVSPQPAMYSQPQPMIQPMYEVVMYPDQNYPGQNQQLDQTKQQMYPSEQQPSIGQPMYPGQPASAQPMYPGQPDPSQPVIPGQGQPTYTASGPAIPGHPTQHNV